MTLAFEAGIVTSRRSSLDFRYDDKVCQDVRWVPAERSFRHERIFRGLWHITLDVVLWTSLRSKDVRRRCELAVDAAFGTAFQK